MPWDVIEHGPRSTVLHLDSVGPGPFRYAATLSYGVADGTLSMSLTVENTGDQALPFGFGFSDTLARSRLATISCVGSWAECLSAG